MKHFAAVLLISALVLPLNQAPQAAEQALATSIQSASIPEKKRTESGCT